MCGTFAACYTVKKDQKGDTTMCKAMEDMRKEERLETSIETAKILLKQGVLSYEQIAEATKLSVTEIIALKEE